MPNIIPIHWLKIEYNVSFSIILFIAQPIKNLFKTMEDVVIFYKVFSSFWIDIYNTTTKITFYIGPIGDLTFCYNKYTFRQVKHYN